MKLSEQLSYANKCISIVCCLLHITLDNIKSKSQKQKYVFARYIVWKILEEKGMSYARMSYLFNMTRTQSQNGIKAFNLALQTNYKDYKLVLDKTKELLDNPKAILSDNMEVTYINLVSQVKIAA